MDSVVVSDSLQVHERAYLSNTHITAAAVFARQAAAVESQYAPDRWAEAHALDQTYAIGAVLSSVAFLEATINEMFADAADDIPFEHLKGLDGGIIEGMKALWQLDIPRTATFPIIRKYEAALAVARRSPLPRGVEPRQSVEALIKLRNALIHHEPVMGATTATPETPSSPHKLEAALRGRFKESAYFTSAGNAFYPSKCLGHGCAAWAVESSVRFVEEFCTLLGTVPLVRGVKAELNLE